jgi:hypothetical protein
MQRKRDLFPVIFPVKMNKGGNSPDFGTRASAGGNGLGREG